MINCKERGSIYGKSRHVASQSDAHEREKHRPPVPELQGKAKHSKEKANPIVSGTVSPQQKVFHGEKPISAVYPVLDTDLARDNVENGIPYADLEEL